MKDIMGEKIIIFIIGLLLGAVIATGAFMVCTKTCHNKGNRGEIMQLNIVIKIVQLVSI